MRRSPQGRRRVQNDTGPGRFILLGAGIVGAALLFLLVSPFSPLKDGVRHAGTDGPDGRAPGVPDGFEALSIHFEDLQQPPDTEGPYALTLPLLEQVADGRNLGLYTFRDGGWARVSAATLVSNGTAASGEVDEVPSNLAVLRLVESAVQITGLLAPGAQPDPGAVGLLTTVNPAGLAPIADGRLAGEAGTIDGMSGNAVPSVRASTPDEDVAVNTILASPHLRDEHVTALVRLALQDGNAGVDIDYPHVSPDREADFTEFIDVLASRLHQANRTLSVTLPSPVGSGENWDMGAYDWVAIAAHADLIKFRAELDPALFFPATEGALTFLAGSGVDLGKVALVVGRNTYERSADGLSAMTLYQALGLAAEIEVRTPATISPNSSVVIVGRNIFQDDGASGLTWDSQAYAVSFEYPGRGGTRTVWLENSLSIAFKLELASRFGLAGVAMTDVSDNPALADYWEPLRAYGESGTIMPAAANSVMLRPVWEVQAGDAEPEAKGNLVWTAPAQPGSYDVALIVSDGVIRASRSLQLSVQAPAPSP
jgi:hypothetical protein